jgi:hypothetical protein
MTKYKVLWPTGYEDHAEGEEFEADLDAEHEERVLERGQLEIVSGKAKKREEGK